MISYEVMEFKIRNGEATLISEAQRAVNGYKIKTVLLGDRHYKLCADPCCLFYKPLSDFTFHKKAKKYIAKCKRCRANQYRKDYREEMKKHIYHRWYAINQKTEVTCTREEFERLFTEERCQFTGRTLAEDFYNPHPNRLMRLEVDHKHPIREGGGSNIENLHVVPKFYNRLKQDGSEREMREIFNLLGGIFGNSKEVI